jgi:hypothetical protein
VRDTRVGEGLELSILRHGSPVQRTVRVRELPPVYTR